ncbi:uncharacterized protein LOC132313814 [Cornus florida]|uniref:uncharacterized protein LOC132313814 n=1 Tax=Cornus florida TaxID=4283 RepID=UPI00289D3459|nr:uncharacterized protein LOC132313814 [Cornus florida]
MEYERIHKVQTGIISPSKLRMKLMGPHHQRKKDGSNSNSSRTSPSKLEDSEFFKNSLLACNDGEFDEEVSSLEVSSVKLSGGAVSDAGQDDRKSSHPREFIQRDNGDGGRVKVQQFLKTDGGNSSSIHPVRALEDENLDYDSNASSSSFEFHKAERSLHNAMARSLSRPMSSKWNDAEKWIMNRQNVQANYSKKTHLQSQANRLPMTNMMRVAPDCASYDQKLSIKRVDFCQSHGAHTMASQTNGANASIDWCPQSKDLKEVDDRDLSCTKSSTADAAVVKAIRSVSMRDMGTEMTPIPSQEPSRTATPEGATTPLRSPMSSVPSTPRRGAPAPTPMEHTTDDESQRATENSKKELSEQELKLKTRREIVALGVQLGKANIAAWASKDEKEKNASAVEVSEELKRIEFEERAAAWEDAEKSKHNARYKREEIRIQAWESQQKAKLEAEMRRAEAQVEQMREHAQAKMVKKIAMSRERSEEKRTAAEARRNRHAEKTAAQAEYIRQTGQLPTSPFVCCGWLR